MRIKKEIINDLVQEEIKKSDAGSEKYRKNRCDAFKEVAEAYSANTPKLIYVCSPCRADDAEGYRVNAAFTRSCCGYVVSNGYIPVAPHIYFTQFLNDRVDEERELGMSFGRELLEFCDEMWVFGYRISAGMREEVSYALQNNIPLQFFPRMCRCDCLVEPEKGLEDAKAFLDFIMSVPHSSHEEQGILSVIDNLTSIIKGGEIYA